MSTYENLQKRLTELRKSRGLSQKELANKLGVSINTIQNCENGLCEPSLDTLRRHKQFFQISFDELIDGNLPLEDAQLLSMISILPIEQKQALINMILAFHPNDVTQ